MSFSSSREQGKTFFLAPPWPIEVDDTLGDIALRTWPLLLSRAPTLLVRTPTWPVIDTSVNANLGSGYATLPRPTTPTRIRYVDTANGNNANDGLTPSTAWKGVKNMVTSTVHCPPTGGTRIYVNGDVDLSDSTQYSSGQPNRFVHTLAPGAAGNPHEIEPLPGTTSRFIKGSVNLRTANYWRWSGFTFDVQQAVGDYVMLVDTSTVHFELSYCLLTGTKDQGLLVENGCSDVHDFCNMFYNIGDGVHPTTGVPGFYDHAHYVKSVPRFLSVNSIVFGQTGGYHFHFYDQTGSNPAPNGRVLHASSFGGGGPAFGTSGGVVDDGDGIIVANSMFLDHRKGSPDVTQSGYPFRWINTTTGGQFRRNLIYNNERGVQLGTSTETGPTIAASPQVETLGLGQFYLLAASPARAAGENWGVLVDHYGRPRTSTPSIGAVE